MKRSDIVLIDWLDSAGNHGWQYSEDCVVTVAKCQTIGFFVDDDKDGICIALNRSLVDGMKPFGDLISIPKKAILRKKILK